MTSSAKANFNRVIAGAVEAEPGIKAGNAIYIVLGYT
jgi:hypothetical protein